MKHAPALLSLLALSLCPLAASAEPAVKRATLILDPTSASLAGGKAQLTTSKLQRPAATYVGSYRIKVVPYFFKNETGTLSIACSDAQLRKLKSGQPVESTGKAVTDGSRLTRPIKVKATPEGPGAEKGSVKISIATENGDLVFVTPYRIGDS